MADFVAMMVWLNYLWLPWIVRFAVSGSPINLPTRGLWDMMSGCWFL